MTDRWDDQHTCYRCEGRAHDIVRDEKDYAVLECAFCGVTERVPPLKRVKPAVKPKPKEDFRFTNGRFAGMTLDEVSKTEVGSQYLEHVRKTNEFLRPVVEAFLLQTVRS